MMSICLSFWILIQAIKLVPPLLIPFILRFNPYPPLFARLSGPISSVLTSWTILPSILIPLSYPSTCLTIGIRWILNFVPLCFANEDKGRSGEERIVLPKNRAISKFFFFLFFYRLQGGGGFREETANEESFLLRASRTISISFKTGPLPLLRPLWFLVSPRILEQRTIRFEPVVYLPPSLTNQRGSRFLSKNRRPDLFISPFYPPCVDLKVSTNSR